MLVNDLFFFLGGPLLLYSLVNGHPDGDPQVLDLPTIPATAGNDGAAQEERN